MTAAAPPGAAAPGPDHSTLTLGSTPRRFRPNRGRPQFGMWLLLVPVALVVVAQLALLVYTGFLSTQDWTLTQSQVSKGWIGTENFTEVLDDPVFWRSVVNSALITGISVPIQLLLGILLAYATFEVAAGRWVRTALLAPMIVAPVAVGIVWRLMLNNQAGPINSFVLAPLGIDGPIWLGEPGLALISVIVVEVWEWTPFVLLLVAAGLTAIREDLREAARTDGASTWQRIRYVELPVLKPVILIVVLFRTLESLMSLDVIISLTRGGPGFSTFTLPYFIYSLGLRTFDIGRASAASLMFMAIAIVLSAAIVRAQLRTDTT